MASPHSIAQFDLHGGDRMSRAQFLSRWERIPELKRAELIDGVVYVPSPGSRLHSTYEALFQHWLLHYSLDEESLQVLPNATFLLAGSSPQPDLALLRVSGSSRLAPKYPEDPPGLIVEICYSSAAYDLGGKLELYRRAGVREYLAVLLEEQKVQWRVLESGRYHLLRAWGGFLKSREFPGLWLDASAVFPPNRKRLLAGVDAGVASVR